MLYQCICSDCKLTNLKGHCSDSVLQYWNNRRDWIFQNKTKNKERKVKTDEAEAKKKKTFSLDSAVNPQNSLDPTLPIMQPNSIYSLD